MLAKNKRSFIKTADSKNWMRQYTDLAQVIVPTALEELWVADISYLLTGAGNYYLHLVSDAYSKRNMGYEVCQDLLAGSSVKALQMALANRGQPSIIRIAVCSTVVDCTRMNSNRPSFAPVQLKLVAPMTTP